jgi:tetratricopeptide (TPR) repeat protein
MTDQPLDTMKVCVSPAPKSARGVFLGLGGIAFIAMIACLAAYRVYGAQITAGLDEACSEAWYDAAQKLAADGNYVQAVEKYRKAMDGHFSTEAKRLECGLAMGDLLFHLKRYDEATETYGALPEKAFTHAGAYTGYVTALARMGKPEDAARLGAVWMAAADAEKKLDQQVWARENLMRAAQSMGDSEGALTYGLEILELDPGHGVRGAVARILLDQGKTDEARTHAEQLVKHPDNKVLQREGRKLLEQISAVGAG